MASLAAGTSSPVNQPQWLNDEEMDEESLAQLELSQVIPGGTQTTPTVSKQAAEDAEVCGKNCFNDLTYARILWRIPVRM